MQTHTGTTLLAIDSAHFRISLALAQNGDIKAHLTETNGLSDAHLIPLIQTLFDSCQKIPLALLTHIVVTLGPGSFTGTRVGLAAARGLGLALQIPVLGVNSFEWVAQSYERHARDQHQEEALTNPFVVVLDSRRAEQFVCFFSETLNVLKEPTYLCAADLKAYHAPYPSSRVSLIGDGVQHICQEEGGSTGGWMPDARDLARYAYHKLKTQKSFDPCKPVYLRAPEIHSGAKKTQDMKK